MANRFITPDIISDFSLIHLTNELNMPRLVFRQYEKDFKSVGDVVRAKKPVEFLVTKGQDQTGQIQDIRERTVNITIDEFDNVLMDVTGRDLTLNVENMRVFNRDYINPAMEQLANEMDLNGCLEYKNLFWNYAATAGTAISNIDELGQGNRKLTEIGVPMTNRRILVNPKNHAALQKILHTTLVAAGGKQQAAAAVKGFVGELVGLGPVFQSQNVQTHTVGSTTQTSVTVDSALTKDSTLDEIVVSGLDGNLVVGDIFTIGSVFAVNARSRQSTGQLQDFVVREALSFTGAADTIKFSPKIIMNDDNNEQQYQNVDSYPQSAAALTFTILSHSANMIFHKNTFSLVTAPLQVPPGLLGHHKNHKGISLTVTHQGDILQFKGIIRLSTLYGWDTPYPELGLRLKT